MNSTGQGRRVIVLMLVAVIGVVPLGWALSCRRSKTLQSVGAEHPSSKDIGLEMAKYMKEGKYDEAIQAAVRSLENKPSDDQTYEGIATVYLVHAQKEPEACPSCIEDALSNAERALALNSKERDPVGVHFLEVARIYEVAGDLSTAKKCTYYERSKQLLETRIPLLQGEQFVLQGKTYPLGPLRKENDNRLDEIRRRMSKGECK